MLQKVTKIEDRSPVKIGSSLMTPTQLLEASNYQLDDKGVDEGLLLEVTLLVYFNTMFDYENFL